MKIVKLFALLILTISIASSEQPATFGKLLSKKYLEMKDQDQAVVLISLKDKGNINQARNINAANLISELAISRRMKVRANVIDEQDFPLNQTYVQTISQNVIQMRHELKWFNAVSVVATKQQIDVLRNLSFVKEIELVGRWKKRTGDEEAQPSKAVGEMRAPSGTTSLDYGTSFTQVNQIKVPIVHDKGIYGQGITVGVFDNGFRLLTHEAFASMHIIAQHDFVDHKESVIPNNPNTGFGSHGVNTLSTIGGYKPGQLIGPAFKADFILARTENDSSETPIEEDNWAKAIEWVDSIGVDVTSTSLGYLTYDPPYTSWTWQDMDGNTTLITKAADRAVGLGIVVVNSAGNDASRGTPNTLIAPADGDSVIAAGAVDASGVRTSFSSYGPTFDGRIKPDVMAMGSGVKVASSTNTTGYGSAAGTSFSCPLSAGVAALIRCANPTLTPMQVRDAMRLTASQASTPDNLMGWGILNADSAIKYFGILPMGKIGGFVFNDLNGNGIKDSSEPYISGKKIYLAGTMTDSTMTDTSGNYLFQNLPIGNYSITQNIPSSWIQTYPASPYSINLLHRVDTTGYNFGITFVPDTGIWIDAGWHLLSLPYRVSDNHKNILFPDAVSEIFTYSSGYQLQDTVPSQYGFWVKFSTPRLLILTGQPRMIDTISVYAGWNLIGGLSVPVQASSIIQEPPNNISSDFFMYDSSYVSTTSILPYVGYWIKVKENGKLILNGIAK